MFQKSFSTNLHWFDLHKPAKLFKHSEVFETSISDFHLLTVTALKMNFQKQKPKIIVYRDYKKSDNIAFCHDIDKCNFNTADLKTFKETVSAFLINVHR